MPYVLAADNDTSELESSTSATETVESLASSEKKITKAKLVESETTKKRKCASVDESLSNVVEKLIEQEEAADKRFVELEK